MALKNIKSNVVAEDILSGIQSAKYNFRRRRGLPKGMDTLKTAHTEMVVYTSILAGGLIGAVRRNLIKTPSDANVLCYAEYKGMQNLSSLLANAGFTHSHNFTSCQQFRASVAAIESGFI
jgi:hypothetical protein